MASLHYINEKENKKVIISKLYIGGSVIRMAETTNVVVPIWERFLLTVKEASLYFNIGENKLHKLVNDYMDSEYKFVIQNGNRAMIKREKFEKFLNDTTAV